MSDSALTGTQVTITFSDNAEAVVVIGDSRPATVARLNTELADDNDDRFIMFEAIDIEMTVWYRRGTIDGVRVSPQVLAVLDDGFIETHTTPGKIPQEDG